MTVLRMAAITWGMLPTRTWDRSSSKVTSRTQKGNIPYPMGAIFNVPVVAHQLQQASGISSPHLQAGHPIDGFPLHFPSAEVDYLSLHHKHLLLSRPVQIARQPIAAGQLTPLQPSVPLVLGAGVLALLPRNGGAVNTVAMSCSRVGWLPLASIT
jgi:hypothetical protein